MVEVSPSSRHWPFAGCYHQLLPVVRSRLKGGFARPAKAGDNNQQTADDGRRSLSLPMQNRFEILPKIIITIVTKLAFLFFEMVVRIRCPVKLELFSPAKMQHAPSSIKLIERAGAGVYLRHLLDVSSRHQHLTVV